MQQTDKYKLNKPGVDDPMAIAPLNENMDKVDAALAGHEQRVIALEGCRVVMGVYKQGSSTDGQIIDLGGRPAAVLVAGHGVTSPHIGFVVAEEKGVENYTGKLSLRIVDNGFQVLEALSGSELTYCFLAFMGDYVPLDIPKYVAP